LALTKICFGDVSDTTSVAPNGRLTRLALPASSIFSTSRKTPGAFQVRLCCRFSPRSNTRRNICCEVSAGLSNEFSIRTFLLSCVERLEGAPSQLNRNSGDTERRPCQYNVALRSKTRDSPNRRTSP